MVDNGLRGVCVGFDDDRVTGWPGGSGQQQVRHPEFPARPGGVRGDRGGEGMGRVDDRVDVRVQEPVPQPVDPAEAADPHLADRQRGVRHPTRERADDIDVWMKSRRERAGLRSTAQQQDPHQCRSPRVRPAEYR